MPNHIRYYQCPHCGRTPHIRFTEIMKDKILEIECEFCLNFFEVDESITPQAKPDTLPIRRDIKP